MCWALYDIPLGSIKSLWFWSNDIFDWNSLKVLFSIFGVLFKRHVICWKCLPALKALWVRCFLLKLSEGVAPVWSVWIKRVDTANCIFVHFDGLNHFWWWCWWLWAELFCYQHHIKANLPAQFHFLWIPLYKIPSCTIGCNANS